MPGASGYPSPWIQGTDLQSIVENSSQLEGGVPEFASNRDPDKEARFTNWNGIFNFAVLRPPKEPHFRGLIEKIELSSNQGTRSRTTAQKGKVGEFVSETDAKIEAAEARTDTKFAQVMGELRVMSERMDHIDQSLSQTHDAVSSIKSTVIVTAITTVLAIGALFYTALQYGNSMFSVGLETQSISERSAQDAIRKAQPEIDYLNKRIDQIDVRLIGILDAIQKTTRDQNGQSEKPN
ncbi:hypothetical protein [Nitratireductor sp. PBL-C9]|uniref:hypothetical protein n=1 Tax=Nitratireductor sp. PBL-C9 TaxID=3435013 RepID=UPI003D7CAF5A